MENTIEKPIYSKFDVIYTTYEELNILFKEIPSILHILKDKKYGINYFKYKIELLNELDISSKCKYFILYSNNNGLLKKLSYGGTYNIFTKLDALKKKNIIVQYLVFDNKIFIFDIKCIKTNSNCCCCICRQFIYNDKLQDFIPCHNIKEHGICEKFCKICS
jgi:hypothetical protein